MAIQQVFGSVWDPENNDYTSSLTNAVERTLQSKFEDIVSVKDFGAVGDGVADDTTAINNALSSLLTTGRRGIVHVPPGTYRTTDTILVAGTGIRLQGEIGEFACVILADHSLGPAVRVKDRRSGISHIEISASSSRTNGASGTNYGILIEADDTAGFRPTHGIYDDILIQDQPNVGLVGIAAVWFSKFTNITIRDCKSHGMQFDFGSLTGRTNTENPGEVMIERCEIFDNDGNGLIIGNNDNQSNRGFRFQIFNLDMFRNAEAAGPRRSADQAWLFMDTSVIEASAFDGNDKAGTTPVTRGMLLHGRGDEVRNCRFLDVTPQAIRVAEIGVGGFTTEGISIKDFVIFGAALDPAVAIDPQVDGINVSNRTRTNITANVDPNETVALDKRVVVVSKTTTQTVNNSTTLVSDDELFFDLLPKERTEFRFVVLYRGDATADIKFGLLVPAGATIFFVPSSGIRFDGGNNIVIQPAVFSTAITIAYGADPTDVRLFELVGEVRTNGTSGQLRLQWAQGTAVVADTQVLSQSHLSLIR